MKKRMLRPCDSWAEQLAAVHPTDLTPAERAALTEHLAVCPGCAAMRAAYWRMDAQIRRLPDPQPLVGLPPRLLQLWAEEDHRAGSRQPVVLPRVSEAFMQTTTNTGVPAPEPAPLRTERRPRRRLVSGITAIAAVLMIAVVTVALFASHMGKPSISGSGANLATLTPGSQGWQNVSALAGTIQPIIAPGNPQIVYEASVDLRTFRRSENDGTTWTNLPLPAGVAAPVKQGQGFLAVNPNDAQNVFLWLNFPLSSAACSANQASTGQSNAYGEPSCSFAYYSTDGGTHWGLMRWSAQAGASGTGIFLGPPSVVQGNHLYLVVFDQNQQRRLIVSTDGGATWQFDDAALRAQGAGICSIAATATGSSLFAFADPGTCSEPVGYLSSARSLASHPQAQSSVTLWRSNNAGADWTKVSAFPYAEPDVNVFRAISSGNAAQPLLTLGAGQGSSYVHLLSTDGGKTWQQVTTQGLPANRVEGGISGETLSDGSLLDLVQTVTESGSFKDWSFYALKPGEQVWKQVTSPFTSFPIDFVDLVAVSSAGGHDTLWVTDDPKGNWSVLSYTLK